MSHSFTFCPACHALNRYDLAKGEAGTARCGKCKVDLKPTPILDVSLDELDTLARHADIPVVVDLWASWCGPCMGFAPVFAKVAQTQAGSCVFAKLDTEKHREATGILGVRGIPTLIAFKHGDEVKRQSGAMPEAMLKSWLTDL